MKHTLIASWLALVGADLSGAANWAHWGALIAPVLVAVLKGLQKPKKRSHHARKKPPITGVVSLILLALVLGGCKSASFPESVRALSGDTNSWFFKVTTPFGGLDYGRNRP